MQQRENVTRLVLPPAYAPLDPPGTCQTPGHGDREARPYAGGMLCDHCITASRAAMNRSDEKQAS